MHEGRVEMPRRGDGFTVEVDSIDEATWGRLLPDFDDASLYQTWPAGRLTCGRDNLSHLVVRRDGHVVGMAQARLKRLPLLRTGIATVFWGPLWRRRDAPPDRDVLDAMVASLRDEYVARRGFLLRVWPTVSPQCHDTTAAVFGQHGFRISATTQPYRTLWLDVSPPLEELRKNLSSNWRNHLSVAEKRELALTEGTSDEMFGTFLDLLTQTMSRKGFTPGVDYQQYRQIQRELPEHLKLRIFVCHHAGEPVAAGVFSGIGTGGVYLLGATATTGAKANASNLLHWGVIKWLKSRGCRIYDLGGIDPAGNPGVYHFKRGLAGKTGQEIAYPGQYYLARGWMSSLLSAGIDRSYYVRRQLPRALKLLPHRLLRGRAVRTEQP